MPPIDTNDLKRYLASLEREDRYRIVDTLKGTETERTELVYLPDSVLEADAPLRMKRGFQNLYVRKYIESTSHLGSAYQRIFDHQQHNANNLLEAVPYIYECYETDRHLIIVMEYLSGETLDRAVTRLGAGNDLACRLFPPICDAVASIHERFDPPLIHRDLKPSNVIVQDSRAVLIDLGIARDFKEDAETDTLLFGTRSFSPPEQFGYKQTTVRSDVYALGMLLYFCLTGTIPSASTHDDRFPGSHISDKMREVLMRATEFDPDKRFAHTRALKSAFLQACAKAPDDVRGAAAGQTPASISKPERFSTLGKIWNVLLCAALALLIPSCIAAFLNPTPQNQTMPIWYNAFAFLVICPLLFISTAVLIADKRRLVRRLPAWGKFGWKRWLASYGALVLILLCALTAVHALALS